MTDLTYHAHHLLQFDGILHWCFLIALFGFAVSALWMIGRVLIPLRQLARQADSLIEGKLPTFEASGGIREIRSLRQSLQHMVATIAHAQEREAVYRRALTENLENERKRIAREIHDDTIQSLILVAHNIERAARAGAAATPYIEAARAQLIQTVDDLRQLIADLRPTVLDELGLIAALEALCDEHESLTFSVEGEEPPLNADQKQAIFRAAQEAIHNALHHAQAKHISMALQFTREHVMLHVRDDGRGFEPPAQIQEFALRGHYGLIGLNERIHHIGGSVTINSQPQRCTQISLFIPLHPTLTPTVI